MLSTSPDDNSIRECYSIRMTAKQCFVIMAIGSVPKGPTEAELRKRYTSLIKDAIERARPGIHVKRADESDAGGSITDEILEDLFTSDYVVAEISYPNPNVFYELGLRHSARPSGTILLRDKSAAPPPFDISVLRYLAYEDTAAGLSELAEKLKKRFDYIDANPDRPDNQAQQVAARVQHKFPQYGRSPYDEHVHDSAALASLFTSPAMQGVLERQIAGEEVPPAEVMQQLLKEPKTLLPLLQILLTNGAIDIDALKPKPKP